MTASGSREAPSNQQPAGSAAEAQPVCWPLVSAQEMRELDRDATETLGVSADTLMENAGRAIAEELRRELPDGAEVSIVCGRGNNGGDGLVAARHLHRLGVDVRVILLGEVADLSADAANNLDRACRVGVPLSDHQWQPPARGVVVDAIFGTGLSRNVEGVEADWIQRINACRANARGRVRVVSVDLPSGLCADTGALLGSCVEADVTLTLGLPKVGLALEPGRSAAGRISVARIGIGDPQPERLPRAELWTRAYAGSRLPARPVAGHKGSFGHALIVAGSEGKTGAAALAAEGAARVGAGLVTIACPAGLNDILEIKCTEAMTAPVADTPERALAASAAEPIIALASTRDALGLGPGIGLGEETQALVVSLAKRLEIPLVVDADGLYPFAREPDWLRERQAPTVVTPHPGEAAALLGIETSEVNRDRPASARELAKRLGSVVALKGAASVIAAPDGRIAINPTGGPALATGGTGDVLLGMLTGLAGGVHPRRGSRPPCETSRIVGPSRGRNRQRGSGCDRGSARGTERCGSRRFSGRTCGFIPGALKAPSRPQGYWLPRYLAKGCWWS
jgi:NAD(P)H-hydrate epimerase